MAGIVGLAKPNQWDIIAVSLDKINHRGKGCYTKVNGASATLGEIHPGPMGMWLGRTPGCKSVCDGAIYNWRSLDEDALDVNQALHNAYERSGPEFVKEIDGSFALAIAGDDGLFIARDTMGVCPLYYGISDGAVCFASEVKAMLGWAEEIHEFPPGYYYHPRQGMTRYSEFTAQEPMELHPAEAAAKLRLRLEEAVAKCIRLHGEVGSWLSGGVDSSALAALASLQLGKIKTFSVGTEGAPDLKNARIVAKAIDSEHHELIMTADKMLELLPEVIYHLESFDALLVRSSITNYFVAKLASEHTDAVFSGEGGDELFAGYSYLKSVDSSELNDELVDIANRLHNTALQRVDRCASAHGLQAHIPFLDGDLRDYAAMIPVDYKLCRSEGMVEKWLLRRAVETILPDSVVNRPKAKFWEGAGVMDLIKHHADDMISDSEFTKEHILPDGSKLNSKEELLYYRIFREHFGELGDLSFVGRTKGAPVDILFDLSLE